MPLLVEKKRGKMRETQAFRVGSEAQMMPTLTSMPDQEAAAVLSQDTSSLLEMMKRDLRRRIETMQTLW